ncbi:MAG: sugar ABC transporter permease [Spirochaetia bacterium]|nr:sugar ABC transporter permease [Spirochaetia bacterium]
MTGGKVLSGRSSVSLYHNKCANSRIQQWFWNDTRFAYLLLTPVLVLLGALTIFPLANALWNSLHVMDFRRPATFGTFVGFRNYQRLFLSSAFWTSLRLTAIFVLISVSFQTVFGFIIALIAHQASRGKAIIRAAILLPWALPTAISAMIWRWMFNGEFGVMNDLLLRFGFITERINWLGSVQGALIAVLIAAIWKVSSFMGLLLLAGLQGISESLYESAEIDGAGRWTKFWSITFPSVQPALVVALIFRTNDAIFVFDLIYVLTGGGPGNSTRSLAMLAYEVSFRQLSFGYGATFSIVLFFISLIISVVYIWLFYLRKGER